MSDMTSLQAEKCTRTEITSQSEMAKRVENASHSASPVAQYANGK